MVRTGYFSASRITLVAGRPPRTATADTASMTPFNALSDEIVVSSDLARRIAPDGYVMGARLRPFSEPLAAPNSSNAPNPSAAPSSGWSTIVGVADDVRPPGPRGDFDSYQLYMLPLRRMPFPTFVVRSSTLPPNVESLLRKTIQSVESTLIVRRARVADHMASLLYSVSPSDSLTISLITVLVSSIALVARCLRSLPDSLRFSPSSCRF